VKKVVSLLMTILLIMTSLFYLGCDNGTSIPAPPTPPDDKFYYSVTLNLDYVVPCTYKKKPSAEAKPIKVARDYRITDLTFAVPIGDSEYSFSYWEYVSADGTKYKVTSSTIFTEEIFGADENVVINAICIYVFTPRV
jgi:hypothetical protein